MRSHIQFALRLAPIVSACIFSCGPDARFVKVNSAASCADAEITSVQLVRWQGPHFVETRLGSTGSIDPIPSPGTIQIIANSDLDEATVASLKIYGHTNNCFSDFIRIYSFPVDTSQTQPMIRPDNHKVLEFQTPDSYSCPALIAFTYTPVFTCGKTAEAEITRYAVLPADVTGNGEIDGFDFGLFQKLKTEFQASGFDESTMAMADLTGPNLVPDAVLDTLDLNVISKSFGKMTLKNIARP